MRRPLLLDLFCCQGGASAGYVRAGFDVVGVDIRPQPRYPWLFSQGDALKYLAAHAHMFDAFHASPPCNLYSITNAARKADYPDLVEPTREALTATGKPWVIENVVGAPLVDPVTLCWSHFYVPGSVLDDDGTPLRMERHRLFESNVDLWPPATCQHPRSVQVAGSYGGARRDKIEAREIRKGGYVPSARVQANLMGIDWMNEGGMYQAIPPAYTEHLGRQLLDQL